MAERLTFNFGRPSGPRARFRPRISAERWSELVALAHQAAEETRKTCAVLEAELARRAAAGDPGARRVLRRVTGRRTA